MHRIRPFTNSLSLLLLALFADLVRVLGSLVRRRSSLIAENLFLHKQLAFYREHQIPPRRLTDPARFLLALWSNFFDYKNALVIVQPATLIRWHRQGFKLFWKQKSKAGRPRLPTNLQRLIAEMIRANATWGQARIANELSLKLGIQVSPRTVRAYWPHDLKPSYRRTSQAWSSFIRNHAQAIVACDFLVAVTARFRILYIFVLLEIGSRRILHFNVTAHPTADWTLQQFREAIPSQHRYRFLIHDRHGTFSSQLDTAVEDLAIRVLKTPPRAPQANAFCERLVGTIRRECLDFMIPLNERHLRQILREWVRHYNRGRPHSSLGPSIPDPEAKAAIARAHRHSFDGDEVVVMKSILGGLHHEYGLERAAA
jgi:putative transposase